MPGLNQFLLRICDSLAYRLRRRESAAAFRATPLTAAGFDTFDTHELLRQLSSSAPRVIYDLGANRGQWTLLAKSVFATAEVHSFEPLPDHCTDFLRHTAGLTDVHLHRVALGETTAELEMDLTTFSDSASLLAPTEVMARTYNVHSGRKVRVPVVRLDDWIAAHKLPPPNLIKLDLQGYELSALRGAPVALARARAVLLELSFREYYHAQPTPGTVIAHLEAAGYRLHALSPDLPAGRALEQADALFVRKD